MQRSRKPGAEPNFSVLHGTVLRREGVVPAKPTAAGLKIHRADTRRDCRQPEFTPARTTCHGRFPQVSGLHCPHAEKTRNGRTVPGANFLCLWRLVFVVYNRTATDFIVSTRQSVPLRLSAVTCGYLRVVILITPSLPAPYSLAASLPRNTSIRLIFWGASRSTSALDACSPLMKIT